MSPEPIMSQELITKSDGTPFSSEKMVVTGLTKLGLNHTDYDIVPYEGGFAARKKSAEEKNAETEMEKNAADISKKTNANGEKYYRVRFHAKSDRYQQDLVELSVNGETLVIERERDVVIPERYLECARNAYHLQYRQLPDEPRKVVGRVMVFPFDVLGEGTRDEFMTLMNQGKNKLQ